MSNLRESSGRVLPWVLLMLGIAFAARAVVDWRFGGIGFVWREVAAGMLVFSGVTFVLPLPRPVSPHGRPRLLTAVGTFWLLVGGCKIVWHSTLLATLLPASSLTGVKFAQLLPSSFIGFYLDHFAIVGVFELGLSLVLLVSALQVLRGHERALPILGAACWIGLLWVFANAVGSFIDSGRLHAATGGTSAALLSRILDLRSFLAGGAVYVLSLCVCRMDATREWIAGVGPSQHEA